MGAYMAESFKDLHVGSDIEQLFRYIEDYKPVHLDVEASRWPFGGRTSQFCRSVVGWGAKWFELLLNIIDFR